MISRLTQTLLIITLMQVSLLSSAACLTFDAKSLQQKKAAWTHYLKNKPASMANNWIIGQSNPPGKAKREAKSQMRCLREKLSQSLNQKKPVKLLSHYRNASRQAAIWTRKYRFEGGAFDKISDESRLLCPQLSESDLRWMPSMRKHRACWKRLTVDQRQREILQASSAPGISRHHWGTDFDIVSLNSKAWQKKHLKEYRWLQKNAAKYGFIQVYTAGRKGEGYFEERWHWSYFPVAQALLDYAKTHEKKIDKALNAQWKGAEKYQYIQKQWQSYVFNVNEKPWF
ncbi:MAG: hypothetical protein HN790_12235 [Methylococcales bacterium]|nr:hypothetical protein [Methylococcales bacterium]